MAAEFDGDIDVPEKAIQIIDDNVLASGLSNPSTVAVGVSYVPNLC